MKGINKVMIIGTLGQDPDTKYTASGATVVNLSVATNESWKDKTTGEKMEKTEWHRVVIFGKLAEIANQYLSKASQVYLEGKIQTRKWTDKDGETRYTTEIVANQMVMLGGGTQDTKRQPNGSQTAAKRQPDQKQADAEPVNLEMDDIPF